MSNNVTSAADKHDIAAVRQDIDDLYSSVKQALDDMKYSVIKWIVIVNVLQAVLLICAFSVVSSSR